MSGDDSFGNLHSSSQDALNALVNAGIEQDPAEQLLGRMEQRWQSLFRVENDRDDGGFQLEAE